MRVVGFRQVVVVPDDKVPALVEAGLVFVCKTIACQGAAHPTSAEAAATLAQRFGTVEPRAQLD